MKRLRLLLLFLIAFSPQAKGQFYQKMVNDFTACSTLSCIEGTKKAHKALHPFSAETKALGKDLQRYLLDFSLSPNEAKGTASPKLFRLSLILQGDRIHYGQLEQRNEQGVTEATYLFKNNFSFLQRFVTDYNQRHYTHYTYKDLIGSVVSREPLFWTWID